MHVGALHAQRVRVLEILGDVALGDGVHGGVLLVSALDHLVVDVGEVLHEGHVVSQMGQKAAQRVKDDERAGVADVKIVVYRRAAGVDADLALVNGYKRLLFAAERVVNHHLFHNHAPFQNQTAAPHTEAWPRFHSAYLLKGDNGADRPGLLNFGAEAPGRTVRRGSLRRLAAVTADL